ncbi:class I SAM-dependent methyltransferase [bacterium]|nr:class I SAM-dependent methyltransferase [bacterium]
MPILQCKACCHFAVQSIPTNLDELYQSEDYYHTDGSNGLGYQDYDSLPFVNWSVEILGSLMLAENVENQAALSLLDIGCAKGYYLDFFKEFGWQTYGSDLSEYAQKVCLGKGHRVVDLADLSREGSPQRFGVVTSFHVIEHLKEFEEFFKIVNGLVEHGAQFFFIVPSVDFSESTWNGHNSSYEHISYFDHSFIAGNFVDKVPSLKAVLSLGSLVCGFAGAITAEVKAVLDLLQDIVRGQTIDNSHKGKLLLLSPIQIAFIASFLARACSSALALELLAELKSAGLRSDWLEFANALAYFQNNNSFGAAAAIGQMKEETLEVRLLKGRAVSELVPVFQRSKSQAPAFPVINIVSTCDKNTPLSEEFFLSTGVQTYPNIRMIHLISGSNCSCRIPEYYRDLIELHVGSGAEVFETLERLVAGPGSYVLLCDGLATLSKYCLFALQHCMEEKKCEFAVPTTEERQLVPSWLPGRRTIQRTLQQFSRTAATAVMFKQDSLAYLRNLFAAEAARDGMIEQCGTPESIVRMVPSQLVAKTIDVLATRASTRP